MKEYDESNTTNLDQTPEFDNTSKESRLEITGLSRKEKRSMLRYNFKQTLETMSKREKISYILYYYKWRFILAIIACFFAIILPITIYKNTRPVAISFAIINASTPTTIDTSFVDDFTTKYNRTKGFITRENLSVSLNLETYLEEFQNNSNSSDYIKFPLHCYNGMYDIVISDKKGIDYCAYQEIITPVDNYLDKAVSDNLSDLLYFTKNPYDKSLSYAIDISNTDFAKNLNLDYDEVYIAFPGTTEENYDNALLIINYIFDIPIS